MNKEIELITAQWLIEQYQNTGEVIYMEELAELARKILHPHQLCVSDWEEVI